MIEFSFAYSKKAQDEKWIATGSRGPQQGTVRVDEATLTPDQRRIIAPLLYEPKEPLGGKPTNSAPIIPLATHRIEDGFPGPHRKADLMQFDTAPTLERILELLPAIHEQKSAVDADVKQKIDEREHRQREELARNTEQAKQRKENERLVEEAKQLSKQKEAAEREAWIAQHGSDHLKKCLDKGYNCNRLYLIERAALEYPGAVLDYNDTASWRERSGPSMAALTRLETLEKKYPEDDVVIVWLTAEPSNQPDEDVPYRGEREVIALKPATYGDMWLFYEI